MSEYSSLKATINANVKTNNNQEITGSVMNSVLNAMVNTLGAGYQFIGVATPTNPGSAQTPDYKCFYIATTPGTYTNLGGLVVADGEVAILKWDTSWTKEVTGIATAESVSQLGQKLIKLVGLGTKSEGTSGVTAVGDVYYNTTLKLLKRCIGYADPTNFDEETIAYYDGAIYTYNNELYVWNGTDLVKDNASIESYLHEQIEVGSDITKSMTIPSGSNKTDLVSISLNGYYHVKISGITPSRITFFTSSYVSTEVTADDLNNFDIYLENIALVRVLVAENVSVDTPFSFIYNTLGELTAQVRENTNNIGKLQKDSVPISLGKNLFDKNSPLLQDNCCFAQDGSVQQGVIYWLISNPIDVRTHQGGKIICNKSNDAPTRYSCFVDADGNKTTISASTSAYTIPANAITAYIIVYKQDGVLNLDEVQIEFGEVSTEYEPYSPISGYLKDFNTVTDILSTELLFPPSPQESRHSDYANIDTAYIYEKFDSWVAKFPTHISKTDLGADSSGLYRVNGYTINFSESPLFRIMFICNQHGGSADGDQVMGAYIATRFIDDICGSGHRHNELLMWIREHVIIDIIPAANPWGIDKKRRVNYNGVNLNRNWPTSGWASYPSGSGTNDYKGTAAGDQAELQCYLTFITQCHPDIIIDNHTLGGVDGEYDANSGHMIMGFVKDAMDTATTNYSGYFSSFGTLLQNEYGITLNYSYHIDGTDTTPDARVWAYENNYYGGLIEMQWRDPLDSDSGFTSSIIEASYIFALTIYQYYYRFMNN